MIYNSTLGYIFECRECRAKTLASIDEYKVMGYVDYDRLQVTCGVDTTGTPLIPAYLNTDNYFEPLTKYPKTLETFVAGNKRIFSKFGEYLLIAEADICYKKGTDEIIWDKSTINFYVPKHGLDDMQNRIGEGGHQPALVCQKLSSVKGLHMYPVSVDTLRGYRDLFIKHLSYQRMQSRYDYFKLRCERF